jgi:hypothetical protein
LVSSTEDIPKLDFLLLKQLIISTFYNIKKVNLPDYIYIYIFIYIFLANLALIISAICSLVMCDGPSSSL